MVFHIALIIVHPTGFLMDYYGASICPFHYTLSNFFEPFIYHDCSCASLATWRILSSITDWTVQRIIWPLKLSGCGVILQIALYITKIAIDCHGYRYLIIQKFPLPISATFEHKLFHLLIFIDLLCSGTWYYFKVAIKITQYKPNVIAGLQTHGTDLSFMVADRCFTGLEC